MTDETALRLGIAPQHKQLIEELLVKYVPSRPVWAFGSRTFGRARRYSDLDLAVGGPQSLPVGDRFELSDAFDASMLPIEVDVIDLNDVDASFRRRIEPDFLPIQEQGETH